MAAEALEIIPEVKDSIRKLLGLLPSIEEVSQKVDLTQRELIETRKLIQRMRIESYETVIAYIKRVSSTAIIFDSDVKQFTFKNPFDKDMRLLALIMIPDATMKTNGVVKIDINKNVIFEPPAYDTSGDWTDIASLDVPIPNNTGKVFRHGESMDVYLWRVGGAGTVNLTLVWMLGQYFS